MIVTQLPDLPPRPETAANAAFRRNFYSRWGRENSIVAGASRHAEYARLRQTLSIKTVQHGREHYYVGRRRLTVSDSTYLVLNEGREYSSVLESDREAFTCCIFFRPGLAQEVARARRLSMADALEQGTDLVPMSCGFSESLRYHDRTVSPVLRYLQHYVRNGTDDQAWYDEQCYFLVERLFRMEHELSGLADEIDCARASKRHELAKRLGWAVDYMHANLQEEISLDDLARAACLSPFHFLRHFRARYGRTPINYLRQHRTERALALLESTKLSITEIATEVGLSRLTLWRSLRRLWGAGPQRLRQQQTSPAPIQQ